jgi:hypothetical protein
MESYAQMEDRALGTFGMKSRRRMEGSGLTFGMESYAQMEDRALGTFGMESWRRMEGSGSDFWYGVLRSDGG